MAFKHRSFSLNIGTSRFGATKIPPSRPLPEPLRDPGLARNVFSLVFFSDPVDFCVINHVLHHLRSHCVTQALLRRCSEGENRCFHRTYLIFFFFRSDNPVSTPSEPTTPQDKGTYGQNRRTTRTMGIRLNMQPEKPTHSKTRNRHPPAHAQNNAAKLIRHAMQRIRHAPN